MNIKKIAPWIGAIASPIIAVAVAFGAMQYTKGQDDLILEAMKTKLALVNVPRINQGLDKLDRINITILDQRIDKLAQIDLRELRELREDIDELDEEFENAIGEINIDLGQDFQEIVRMRSDIDLLKAKLEKIERASIQ